MRTGLIALKLGMSRVLDSCGFHIPVTICKIDNCRVISVRTMDRDGYNSIQVGYGSLKRRKVSKPMLGYFQKLKVEPAKKIREFRIRDANFLDIGYELNANHFVSGQYVDATSISIGKGFAGTMKRYNFSGMSATHGVSVSHRSQGSTGQCQDPGKVFKGTKMAGHMGAKKVTIQNLLVYSLDIEENLVILKGSVPGSVGSYILLRDAIKK